MMHPNQMRAPISRRAMLHLNPGGPAQLYVNPETGEVSMEPKEGFVADTSTGAGNQAVQDAQQEQIVEAAGVDPNSGAASVVTAAAEAQADDESAAQGEGATHSYTGWELKAYESLKKGRGLAGALYEPTEVEIAEEAARLKRADAALNEGQTDAQIQEEARPEGVPAGAVQGEDGTWTMGEEKWNSDGTKVEGTPPETPEEPKKIAVTNPNGITFDVEESTLQDGGTVIGPGGNKWSVTKSPDGKWILSTPEGPRDLSSAADTLKSIFNIDNEFLGRTLLYYLGGRMTGGSHAGSLQWAGKQAIKELNTRQVAAAKNKPKRTGKEGTVTVDGGQYNGQTFNTFEMDGPTGKITYADLGGGNVVPLSTLRSTVREQGGTVQDGSGQTREQASQALTDWGNGATTDITTIVDQVNARDPKTGERKFRMTITPAEIANQAVEQFDRMGYDVTDPVVLRRMNDIIAKATRGLLAEQQANPDVDVNYINAYINREIANISTGLDYNIYQINPDEADVRKQKFVSGRKIETQRKGIEDLVRQELGPEKSQNRYEVELKVRQWYQQLAVAWDNMSDEKKKEILGKQSPLDDENDFYLFVQGRIAKGKDALNV